MSANLINTKVAAAIAASEAGDYATATTLVESAKLLLAAMPDRQAGDGVTLTWDRAAIDTLLAHYRRRAGAAVGITRTKITYTRPTS